jgi:hypothetical protein
MRVAFAAIAPSPRAFLPAESMNSAFALVPHKVTLDAREPLPSVVKAAEIFRRPSDKERCPYIRAPLSDLGPIALKHIRRSQRI